MRLRARANGRDPEDRGLGKARRGGHACLKAKRTRPSSLNVHVHCGDGTLGLPELAPFDAILVAAAAPAPPQPLLAQLAEGGRMIIPVGDSDNQELQLIEKRGGKFSTKMLEGCRFVPLVGHHAWQKPPE